MRSLVAGLRMPRLFLLGEIGHAQSDAKAVLSQFTLGMSDLGVRSLVTTLRMPKSHLLGAIWACAAQRQCCTCPVCSWPSANLAD